MSRPGVQKHTHKYYRFNGLWTCGSKQGCSHYRPGHMPEPIGVKSICWTCDGEIILTNEDMTRTHPTCEGECRITRESIEYVAMKQLTAGPNWRPSNAEILAFNLDVPFRCPTCDEIDSDSCSDTFHRNSVM